MVCAISLSAQDEVATTIVKLGQQVPAFSFQDESGKTVSVGDLKGKVVMITFFATWCPPCRQELPHIQSDIYNKYKDNPNFRLLIFGREHTVQEVTDFKTAQNFTMPFYADKDKAIYSKFASKFIPRNFVVGTDGQIIYSSFGFNEKDFGKLKSILQENIQK